MNHSLRGMGGFIDTIAWDVRAPNKSHHEPREWAAMYVLVEANMGDRKGLRSMGRIYPARWESRDNIK